MMLQTLNGPWQFRAVGDIVFRSPMAYIQARQAARRLPAAMARGASHLRKAQRLAELLQPLYVLICYRNLTEAG